MFSIYLNKLKEIEKDADFCLYEEISKEGLKILMSDPLSYMVSEELTKFNNYAKLVEEEGGRIVYYKQKVNGIGRLTAVGSMSIQGFSSNIRNYLAHGLYHDIDMVNAHPVILIELCKRFNLEYTELQYYINNREKVLKDVADSCLCGRKEAKILMLILMYGGGIEKWIDTVLKPKKIQCNINQVPKSIKLFKRQLRKIGPLIINKFPEIEAPNKDNEIFSKLSLIIQDFENKIMLVLANKLKEFGYIPGVYVFDGIMVRRKDDGNIKEEILRACEDAILKELKFPIKIDEKFIEKGKKRQNITTFKEQNDNNNKKNKLNKN